MEVEIDLDELEKEKADNYYKFVFEIFPDVDPGFLESKCIQYAFDQEGFNKFIEETMFKKKYPIQEPCTSQSSVENRKDFTVTEFIHKYPDPQKYFLESNNGLDYITHSISFLQDRFRYNSAHQIRTVLRKNNFNLWLSYKKLEAVSKSRKTPRQQKEIIKAIGEPPAVFFDERNFILHRDSIFKYLDEKRQAREAAVAEARNKGALLTCSCCFSDDLLSEDTVTCLEGHLFCKDCVKKSTEVLMGEGKIDFPCLEDCEAFFDLGTLKDVMENSTYDKLQKKIQEREIAQANIPGLESCPFCEYSAIPDPSSRIFDCLGCKKSSCRLCQKESHIPYRCSELDDAYIKNRTYVEEKMTAALIRNCHQCGSKFVREDGCNKMTCVCGALMCYLCRKPISGYSHFNDNVDETISGKCPLWTENSKLHTTEVNSEAEKAIEEVKRKNPDFDPELYKKLKK